jgi:hypothetical protein
MSIVFIINAKSKDDKSGPTKATPKISAIQADVPGKQEFILAPLGYRKSVADTRD